MQKNLERFCHFITKNIMVYILGITCIISSFLYPMGMGQFPGMPNLTPEEMQALEQELAQAAQAIEQHVNSLSPEEQAEFHRAVNELEQMMSTMSEEELNQFFESVIAQELSNAQEVPPTTPAAVPGAPIAPKEPQAVVLEQKFTTEQQKALNILTSLVELTDSFMVKMQNVPDIEPKFLLWLGQGKLANVDRALDWNLFKKTIEIFKKDISDMRKIDNKTKKYLFLDALTKNDILYRELTNLESQLKAYEPRVQVVSFGIERLSSDTKNAIQKIISSFGHAVQSTSEGIKKLFETYEPEAQKIREEEKKQLEKAKAEMAQQRRPTPAVGTTTT